MYPDYNAMVNEFVRPVVSLFLFVFLILGWLTAFMLMRENTILKIKLGKEDERLKEGFKIWLLRKTAPFVFSLYTVKASIQEQIQPSLKYFVRKNRKILKLAFRLNILTSILSTVFGIVSSRTIGK